MNETTAGTFTGITDVMAGIADAVADALPCDRVAGLADEDLLAATGAIEALGRRVDALRVTAAGEIADRSRKETGKGGLAVRKACRTPEELLQRITLVSGATAHRRVSLAAEVRRNPTLVGFTQRARFDRVTTALHAGTIGIDAATAITRGLSPLLAHSALDDLAAAERELVAAATGTGPDTALPDTALPVSADEVRIQASVWRAALDPDGLEPSEEQAMTGRRFHIGRLKGGLVPMYLSVLPEAAGRVAKVFDPYLTPTTAPAMLTEEENTARTLEKDPRSRDQQRHDVFIAMIDTLARSGDTPTVGGAAPTVLVSVRAEELDRGRGAGFSDGVDIPLSMTTVKQMICTGGTQTVVLTGEGRILALGSPQRCFTPQQRRAITLRDGGCLIPGCTIPAGWCEIHHVIPDAAGGPTHTDNGVLLCWFHHRTIPTSGWTIRMKHGTPQIKAPPWLEPNAPWRTVTKSRTTLTQRLPRHPW